MPISVVFDPPLPSDSPSTFNTKAFTLLGDLNDWSTQANALPGEVATNLSALLAAPPAIGSTTPAAGSFTTVTSDSVTMKPTGSTAKGWLLPEKNWLGSGVSESMALVSMTNIPVYTGGSTSKTAEFSSSGLAVTGALSAGNGTIQTVISYDTGGIIGTMSNHSLKFFTNALPKMTLDTSGNLGLGVTPSAGINACLQIKDGIKFPATQVPSADVNTLDDYEEGTWTPTQGAGLTVVGTFSSSGTYTKIGRQVTVSGSMNAVTSIAVAQNGIMCGGLPFSRTSGGESFSAGNNANTSFYGFVSGGSLYSGVGVAAASYVYFTATYFV